MIEWKPINERIISDCFQTRHAKVTVIQVYAPTNEADDSTKDSLYNLLQDTFNEIPNHDIKILIGDLNSQISYERNGLETTIGPFGSAATINENGERFTSFCNLNNVSISNTFFRHKLIHKFTWLSPDHNTRKKLDYISINNRWRSSLQDVRVFRGADYGSDHFLLTGKMKLKFKRLTKSCKQKSLDLGKLKIPEVKQQYALEINNRFSLLEETEDIERRWDTFKTAVDSAVKATIVYIQKGIS